MRKLKLKIEFQKCTTDQSNTTDTKPQLILLKDLMVPEDAEEALATPQILRVMPSRLMRPTLNQRDTIPLHTDTTVHREVPAE